MVIEVLYMSKNATTRHRTKSDFAVTYRFHSSACISGPLIGCEIVYAQILQFSIYYFRNFKHFAPFNRNYS